jgi:hypothetical protein
MRLSSLLLAALAVVALRLPAQATPIADAGITRGEVAAFLKAKGYPVTPSKLDNGQVILKSKTPSDVNFDIYFYDCDSAGRCPSVQFAAGFPMTTAVPRDRLNAWNNSHRYMRAYVQPSGGLYGEIDMILAPGGTTEQLETYRTLWNDLIAKFKQHFGI